MRPTPVIAVAGALSACSPPADAPREAEPAALSGQIAPRTGEVDPLSASGADLRGDVGGLSGEVTDFRIEQTANQTVVEIASDVLFAFDKAGLSAEAPPRLRRAVDLIRQGGSGPIEVRGYTDSHGDDAYNLELSQRRATTVAGWLSSDGGIDASRLRPRGYGEADPVAPNEGTAGNDYPEGRALNRRVTIIIPR